MHNDGMHYSQTKQVFCRFNRVHLFLRLQQQPPYIFKSCDDVHNMSGRNIRKNFVDVFVHPLFADG